MVIVLKILSTSISSVLLNSLQLFPWKTLRNSERSDRYFGWVWGRCTALVALSEIRIAKARDVAITSGAVCRARAGRGTSCGGSYGERGLGGLGGSAAARRRWKSWRPAIIEPRPAILVYSGYYSPRSSYHGDVRTPDFRILNSLWSIRPQKVCIHFLLWCTRSVGD